MSYSRETVALLEAQAKINRRAVVEMIAAGKTGHPGGGLSSVEIATTLFSHVMRVNPTRPNWRERDRFVLSKGHGCASLYAALAGRGFIPKETFQKFRQTGGMLQGHPDMRKVAGVDMSTGSLGQGLSAALGMALAAGLQGLSFRVYALLGDGEIQEGQIWEAAMAAAHFRVDNLTAILDFNRVQLDGRVSDIMGVEPVADKWQAFGWEVIDCPDGHDVEQLLHAFDAAHKVRGKPAIIVAHTVKGKGVSFMENLADWHGVSDASRLPAAVDEVNRL